MAKIDVFNTTILNNNNMQEIYKNELKSLVITDLMDISEFKIAQHKELFLIYIKYPIIKNRCNIYYAGAISQNDGKLI